MKHLVKLTLALFTMLYGYGNASAFTHQNGEIVVGSSSITSTLVNTVSFTTSAARSLTIYIVGETTNPTTIYASITATAYSTAGGSKGPFSHSFTIYTTNSGFTNDPISFTCNGLTTPVYWEITIKLHSSVGSGYRCDFEAFYQSSGN